MPEPPVPKKWQSETFPGHNIALVEDHCSTVLFLKLEKLWEDKNKMLQELVFIHVMVMIKCKAKGWISQGL